MEILEESNPLQTETKASSKVVYKFKNNVGRPTRKNEILFSPPPKSIISQLLREERCKKIKDPQDQSDSITEKTHKPVEKQTYEVCPEGMFNGEPKLNKCDHPKCSYSTKFRSNLRTHKKIHKSDYQYICDECTFRSRYINSLKAHKRLHSIERPYKCQNCEYKCNSASNLKKHCSRKHSNISNNSNNAK